MLGNATHIHVCMGGGKALRHNVPLEVADFKYYFHSLELMLSQKMSIWTTAADEFKGPYAEPAVRSPSETEAPPQSPPAPYPAECCAGRMVCTAFTCQSPGGGGAGTGIHDSHRTRTPSR